MGSHNQYGNSAIRDRNRRSMNRGARSRAYSGSNDGGFWSELPRSTKRGVIAFVVVVGIIGISVGASGGSSDTNSQANQVAQNSGQQGNGTTTEVPTLSPTEATASPTANPTVMPTGEPIAIGAVTDTPTATTGGWKPNRPSKSPTLKPTTAPTGGPTILPTPLLSREPTTSPSESPTLSPTEWPTYSPTEWPTYSPTEWPTYSPTGSPIVAPTTAIPTSSPSTSPTSTPTSSPTSSPTFAAEMVISNIQTSDGTNLPPPQVPLVRSSTGYRLGDNEYKVFEFSTPTMDLQLTRAWLWLIGSSISQDISVVMFSANKTTDGNMTMFSNVTNRIVFGNETPPFPVETETTNFNYQFVPTFVDGTTDYLMANHTYFLSVDAGVPGALWQVNCYNETNCEEPDQSIPEGKLKLEALYKNTPEDPRVFYPDPNVNAFAIEARYV